MSRDSVGQSHEQRGEDAERQKVDALSHGTRHDRRCSAGERDLEEKLGSKRDGRLGKGTEDAAVSRAGREDL